MGFNEFSIQLDTNRLVFYPGEVLSGHVIVDLKKPVQMGGVKIKFEGKAKCKWTEQKWEGEGEERKLVPHHIKGKESLFEFKTNLFGSSTHGYGRHKYNFVFNIPQNLPSSFEGQFGHIRYELEAEVEMRGKKDLKARKPITINEVIDTNIPEFQKTPGGEVHKEVGCLCWKAGPLSASAHIDRVGYCPGELILINSQVQNETTRDMKSMKVKLIQSIQYTAEGNLRRHETNVIARLDSSDIPKGKSTTWSNKPLAIPATLPSIDKTRVIKVSYAVKFEVDVPWGMDPSIDMPIVMGTVPFRACYGSPQHYGLPQETMPVANSNSNNTPQMPPPPPNLLGYPDMAPPSYAAVVGSKQVNIHKGDKYEASGKAEYIPVYTFAQPYQGKMKVENYSPQSNVPPSQPPPVYPPTMPYPPQQPGYPPQQPGYAPQQPGYPPQQPGYPPQQPGYPPQPGFAPHPGYPQ